MKTLKFFATLLLTASFFLSQQSCSSTTVVFFKKDNGKHLGWFKNPKNPHHPRTTNPKPKGAPKGKPNKK